MCLAGPVSGSNAGGVAATQRGSVEDSHEILLDPHIGCYKGAVWLLNGMDRHPDEE